SSGVVFGVVRTSMEHVPKSFPFCGAMRISLPPMTRISRAMRTISFWASMARTPSHHAFWVIDQSRRGVAPALVSGDLPLSGFAAGVDVSLADFFDFFGSMGGTARVPGAGRGEIGISHSMS